MLPTQGSTVARQKCLSRVITMVQEEVLEWPRSQMVGILPFDPNHHEMLSKPYISVEATAKGLIGYRSLES